MALIFAAVVATSGFAVAFADAAAPPEPTTTTTVEPTTVDPGSDPTTTSIAPTDGISSPTAKVACNGVALDDGQADIDAHDPGTRFCISGTHSWSLVPKDRDIFVGGTLDGGGTLVNAFSGDATKVTISNVTIVDYSPAKYGGAIDATGDGWTLRNVTVSGSAFDGVAVGGSTWTITGGWIHDNGQLGIEGEGSAAADLTINGVELDHNGFDDTTYTKRNVYCMYGSGGVLVESTGVTIRNSYVHDNACQGISTRRGADAVTIVDNRVDDNWDEGIFIDISGNVSIQTNEVSGNGFHDSRGTDRWPCGSGFGQGSGILVNTSGQIHTVAGAVDVGFNSVALNCNGVTGVDQVRTEMHCSTDPICELRNVNIHDNTIVGSIVAGAANQAGWWADADTDLTTHALSWDNNDLSAGIVFSSGEPTSPTTTTTTTTPTSTTTTTTTTVPRTTTTTNGPTTTTTAPTSTGGPVGLSGAWTQTFGDEFNGSALDRNKWNTWGTWERSDGGRSNIGNGELDYKTDGDNFSIANGALTIQARRESAANGMGWTSGQLGSKQAFTYGYIETRAQFAAPKGFLNALWTWGAPNTDAAAQETDTFEFYSDNHGALYATAHTSGGGGCQGLHLGFDPTAGMHVYGSDIEPTGTDWYIDGVKVCHAASAPNQPWNIVDYMTVNSTLRAPIALETTTHAEYVIDYVRAWQR